MEPQPPTGLRPLLDQGVLLTSRALAAGWPQSSLARRLQDERWVWLRKGAWAEPGTDVDPTLRLKAAQLLHPDLVVSHRTAARLWLIETLTDRNDHLTFTDPVRTSRRRLTDAHVHRLPLAEPDVESVGRLRLRTTSVPRTLGDLLRTGPRDEALVAVESALTRRTVDGMLRPPLLTPPDVTTALAAPLLGGARARKWLALADLGAGSPAETIARLRMYDAGLRPETQAEVRTRDGRRRYLDFFFRAEGLAIEIEGYAYHGTRDAHRRDLDRFNALTHCPEIRHLLRYPATTVLHHPTHMLTEIHAALARV